MEDLCLCASRRQIVEFVSRGEFGLAVGANDDGAYGRLGQQIALGHSRSSVRGSSETSQCSRQRGPGQHPAAGVNPWNT